MSDVAGSSGPGSHRRRGRALPAVLAVLLAASLVGGGILVNRAWRSPTAALTAPIASVLRSSSSSSPVGTSSSSPEGTDLTSVVAQAMESVVSVQATTGETGMFGQTMQAESQGSGVIVGTDLVVTNSHVVEGAGTVTVSFGDDAQDTTATVLGTDPVHDLAVLSVPTEDHPAIAIGSSSSLELGQQVLALGYPLGLGATVTAGIVSGLDRTIDVSGSTPGNMEHLEGLLQTDAAINPGNSGGPLIDASGRLVGINTAGASASSAENIGFAIAIDEALPVIQDLSGAAA